MQVFIDTRGISENFFMDEDQVKDLMDSAIKELTARFAQEWENEANRTLKASRQEYVANITVVDEGFAKGAVMLTGWLPNAVEQGLDPYDMKDGLLNGPSAKIGKDGSRYNTIPFTHGVPGSQEENFNGGIMPVEIHNIVKKKPMYEPLTKKELPRDYSQPKVHQIKGNVPREYTHKSPIYEGVSKRKDKVTGQNSYVSFRRVSDNSSPDSWISNGIEARHISDRVLNEFNVPAEMSRILDKYLGS